MRDGPGLRMAKPRTLWKRRKRMFYNGVKLLTALAVCAAAFAVPAAAHAADVKFRANFTATPADPLADGHAEWRLDTQTGQLRLSVEVEDVASTNLAMAFVNGRFVGVLVIVNGFADLNLDSFKGDRIPRVTNGTLAEVRRASDGALLLFGTFVPD